MSLFYHQTKLLTAKALRCNSVGHLIGYWKIKTKVKDRTLEFTIVQNGLKEEYLVAVNHPFILIGTATSLRQVAQIHNDFVCRFYVPKEVLEHANVNILTTG